MSGSATAIVKVTHRFAASAERVFDAWLDAGKVRDWMRAALTDNGLPGEIGRVEIDPRVGGGFTFSDMRSEGEVVHWGRYLAIERPRRLVFTWFTSEDEEKADVSTVTLTIEPAEGGGCVATITHEMQAKWAEFSPQIERGWSGMLAGIDRLLGDG
jgi:uncharacterized protein YndB with AHSA1/START domain